MALLHRTSIKDVICETTSDDYKLTSNKDTKIQNKTNLRSKS